MNSNAKTIALIDDDDGPILYYETALKDSGFEVVRLKTFKAALEYIQAPSSNPDMWIIDVMIPIGDESLVVEGVEAIRSTSFGLGAGLLLYKMIKERHSQTPAILLTNITTPQLLDDIERSLCGHDSCETKLGTLPSDLVSMVKSRIGTS
jgi:CheY-like chemotaxis protein